MLGFTLQILGALFFPDAFFHKRETVSPVAFRSFEFVSPVSNSTKRHGIQFA